jgi:rRNA maturation RNase YbeY
MFISLNMVKYNGAWYKEGYKRELKRVIIHGCLHLAGYNDSTKKERELIRSKEQFYLSS